MTMSMLALNLPLHGVRLIEASAGTGKTYTIAALYLRLILAHREQDSPLGRPLLPSEILVVTFTEAATKELRDRIRERLSEAARVFRQQSPSDDAFLCALRAAIEPEQWQACAYRLELAAQSMDEAAVYTIHGWCHRMLQQYAFDSGCLFQQELHTQHSELLHQTVQDYWRVFYYPLTLESGMLDSVYQCFATPEQLYRALYALLEDTELPVSTAGEQDIPQLLRDYQQQSLQQLAVLKQHWPQWLVEIRPLLEQAVKDKVLPATSYRSDFRETWFNRLQQWAENPYQRELELGKGFENLSAAGLMQKARAGVRPPQHPAFEAISHLQEQLADLPELRPQLLRHALLWIRQRYSAEKQRLAQLGFNDLLLQLDQALSGPRGPSLVRVMRQQFPVALIDEFQDTDPVQYRIFSSLYPVDASAASACLMIGDPKQAIYSFRGADIFTYLQAHRATHGRHYTLDTNFRSSAELVAAVNAVFLEADRHPQGAFLFRQGDDDPLPFQPVRAKGRDAEWRIGNQPAPAMTIWYPEAADSMSLSDYRRHFAEVTATQIVDLLNQTGQRHTGFFGTDDQQFTPLQPGDIAVLVRNHHEAGLISDALSRRRVRSVFLSVRDSIYDSQEARDMLIWLAALTEPRDERKVRSALATATLGWSYLQLQQTFQDESAWENQLERFASYHHRWLNDGILPALRQLIHDYGLHVADAEDHGSERRLTNLLHLAELLQQAASGLEGESALLRFLAEAVADGGALAGDEAILRLESDANLIKIVTIHKAKGLEYPLVFLPFCCDFREVSVQDQYFRYHDDQQRLCIDLDKRAAAQPWSDRERLQEDIRLLYVALTRARFACWLGVAAVRSGPGKHAQLDKSAIGHVLGWDSNTEPAALVALLQALAATCASIHPTPAPVPLALPYSPPSTTEILDTPRRAQRSVSDDWWIASFSALSVSETSRVIRDAPETAPDSKRWEETESEASKQAAVTGLAQLPRGSGPGVLIHALLEQAGRVGFAETLQQPAWVQTWLERNCGGEAWLAQQALLSQALQRWLSLPLLPDAELTLARLVRADYQVEMEFLLAVNDVDVRWLDQQLQQQLFPHQVRPPLLAGQLHGLVKGFIDLVFTDGRQYFLADYKFNHLGDSAAYEPAALRAAMLSKRYDLQLALYALAVHRLLRQRLRAHYDYERDFGGCVYLFLRGWDGGGQGQVWVKPPLVLIQALDAAFAGGEG